MRKFIFSLKSLVMTLALVVGGSAWAQIASLPFVADFSSGDIAPFTGGSAAFVATVNDGSDAKVIAANNGEAYAQFATPYAIGNMDEVTVSFQMLNGWLGSGAGNKFAILNSEGVALAAVVYDNKSCNFTEVILDNTMAEDFTAFNGQSSAGAKGANGYDNGKGQGFKINTAETKYNPEVTIKINSFGGISVSIVGGNNNNNVTYSRAAQPGTKLDLDKVYITNASNNGDRATGYYDLKITSKSMIKYSNDYSDDVVTWTSATGGRYTPIIQDGYLTVNQDERNNNGTTITSTETEGKVAAGENFTMSCRVKLGASTNQSATAFNIYDAANSAAILSIAEVVTNATAWTINNGTQTATVSAGGGKAIDELAWIDVKVTSIAGGKTYLTLKDADGNIIDGFDKKDIPTLSTEGGLGKMNFVTSRYNANFAIDDIIVRDVVESEDIPATPIYTYTVKYVDQDNFEFKEPAKREEYEGVELAITDEDKETVIHGSIKYTYVSDDAEGQTAASDGSTVITVTFNKTTVTDYTVNFFDTSNGEIKAAVTHKNVLVGTEVSATQGELSKILKEGVFYEYASGNEPITLVEDAASNVINLYFAPVEGVTGYFFNNYEDKTVDWTTATGGRYDPIAVDGSKIADRGTTERKPVVDPETGEIIDYEEVPGLSIPFGNKTYFMSVNQANRNNNGVTNGVSSANFAVEQADFTLETKIILGTSNNQGCSFQIKNFAGDANILQLIPTAVGSTTWVVNGDNENFAVELPGTGTFAGTDNNNLTNYDWYDLKVTVYNGTTFVTITDKEGTAILDKAQVPTLATTYGVSKMIFYTGRYNSNIAVDDVTVRSVVTSEDVPAGAEFVAVKINYVDEAGTPLKESAEVNFQVGQPIVLNEALVADFKVDAEGNVWTAGSESVPVTKYIYVSDNSDEVEVALGAEVNIIYRGVGSRRVAFRPQIQKVDGTITSKDDAGKNFSFFYDSNKTGDYLFEGDVLTYYYPFYFLADGLLYQTANNSDGSAKATLDIPEGTSTLALSPITWTPALESIYVIDPETGEPALDPETQEPIKEDAQIKNAIFAQESENIEGMTVVKDQYTTIRQANGAAGSAIGGNVLIANLEPGTYTITSATRSGLTNFLAGDEVVFSVESSGTVVTSTSGEFTVDQTTPLYIEEQSAISKYSDYVLVRKIASIASYPINVAEGIEGGTVEAPSASAADATVKVNVTPDKGYELASLTITCVNSETEINYDINDYSFTMPAEPVFITATFQEKVIYIETDLTSQFDALTDWRKWTGATGYTATNFCPAVTTNTGKTVQVCERYEGTCANNGDVFYQTVTGLTPGTYKIELYGGAAFTFGRGFGSMAFTGDLSVDHNDAYQAGDKIDPTPENPTGVTLYAQTSEGQYGGELPIFYATNFPEGASVITIDGVQVGTNGEVKIGMLKEHQSTNWHVIQLKGVTAKVLASDLLATAAAPLKAYTEDDLTPEMFTIVQETLIAYDQTFDTVDEYIRAIAALNSVAEDAANNAELVANTKAVEGASYNYPVETEFVVNGTFDNAIAPWITTTGAQNSALASNQQGAFTVPFWENWNPDPYTGKMYQTINNIPNGLYTLKIAAFVNNFAGDNQASQFVYANGFRTFLTTGEPTAYEVTDVLVRGNSLEIGFEQTEAVANWAGIDNVSLLYHGSHEVYNITTNPAENGTLVLPAKASAGEVIVISSVPAEGYELASAEVRGVTSDLVVEVETDPFTGEMVFTMPEDGVSVTATFQEAYVKLSDFAYATDGVLDEDGSVKVTGTFSAQTAGSYSDFFFGDVAFKYNIKDSENNVVYPDPQGEEEYAYMLIPGDKGLADGVVSGYVPGLIADNQYVMTVYGVEAWDYMKMYSDLPYVIFQQELLGATVEFTATVPKYEIVYADGMVGGIVTGPVSAAAAEEVTLTVTPAEGYELASIAVTNEAGEEIEVMYDSWDGIATFEMPAEAVYVAATFQEAYVRLSDFAIASTGILDEDGDVEITGTYTFETAGSYSEMFFGEVVYDLQITAEGLAEPIEVSITGDEIDGEVSNYVANLVEGTQYTANLVGVHVWDYNSFTEIFTKVAELGGVLATTQFTVINQPVIEPLLVDINVERYVGYGYTPTVAEVDFTDALEFLGVDEITTDMLSFVNPDLTTISYADYMAANYDGWCDETGKATNWGSTTKICVKFFQAVEDGKYEICDMNGADEVGATYTVRWVANVDTKVVVFTTNVTFVEEPTPAPEIAAEVDVPVVIQAGTAYEGATATFNIEDVTGPLFLDDISEAAQYIVNVTDGSFVPNSTDGWRDANGDAATWGTGDGMVCVKIQQPATGSIDYIGAIDQTYQDGDTYTAKWGFVNTASNTAVVLNINITFSDDPTGFAELKAADGVKPNGKYIEGNKVVIWQNGTKFSTSGTIAR